MERDDPMPLFTLHPDGSFRSRSATIVGDVTIGPESSFWFNTVVRGDVAPITIGARVNVQDGAIIHCDTGVPNIIEDEVSIAHGAIVHGAFIGRGTLIGMGAKVLGRTRIGAQCLIAAGAVVPPGLIVPDRHLVLGLPGRVARPLSPEDLKYLEWLPGRYIELARKYINGDFTPT